MTMTPNETVFDHDTLASAEETLRVAIALGYPYPAFPGTVVYSASVTDSGDGMTPSTEELGVYDSEAAARIAVRNWVVNRYYEMGEHPLLDGDLEDEMAEELEDYSSIPDDQIIEAYFRFWDETTYDISRVAIQSMPEKEN